MKIAITGGSGFIGTALTKLLSMAGHDITIIDIRPSAAFPDLVRLVDVRDPEPLHAALKGSDAVYHLAAEHRDDVLPVEKYYDVNVEGGKNVYKAASALGIKKIVFTSSVAVYGLNAGESKETDRPAPFNDYGASKLQSEQTFSQWARESPERSLTVTRLVATFGPGNRGNIYTLMNQIASGKFLMIGDGLNCKSIAYIGNVSAFLLHALSFRPGVHLYNYADKPDLNMREMVLGVRGALGRPGLGFQIPYAAGLAGGAVFDAAAKITKRTFPISTIRVKKFCANTIVNADRAFATGFKAPYSLNDGLREMIEAEFYAYKKAA